jgi:tetratricopeptide (TPR) repeat protein
MANQYYAEVNGAQAGPFGVEALAAMAAEGSITAESRVWTEGMADWTEASAVDELAGLFAKRGPPPPPKAEAPLTAAQHHAKGLKYAEQDLIEQAKVEFLKAIEADPKNPEYHALLGRADFELKQWQTVIDRYTQAISLGLGPESAQKDAYLFRAMCHEELKNYPAAHDDACIAYEMMDKKLKNAGPILDRIKTLEKKISVSQ